MFKAPMRKNILNHISSYTAPSRSQDMAVAKRRSGRIVKLLPVDYQLADRHDAARSLSILVSAPSTPSGRDMFLGPPIYERPVVKLPTIDHRKIGAKTSPRLCGVLKRTRDF